MWCAVKADKSKNCDFYNFLIYSRCWFRFAISKYIPYKLQNDAIVVQGVENFVHLNGWSLSMLTDLCLCVCVCAQSHLFHFYGCHKNHPHLFRLHKYFEIFMKNPQLTHTHTVLWSDVHDKEVIAKFHAKFNAD